MFFTFILYTPLTLYLFLILSYTWGLTIHVSTTTGASGEVRWGKSSRGN